MARLHRDVQKAFDEGFTAGFANNGNPYLRTSACWEAWEFGRHVDANRNGVHMVATVEKRRGGYEIWTGSPWSTKWRASYAPCGDVVFYLI